ncbi:GGDEF domain-containing protein [Litoribrevibacter albus]|uniref:diguanylate cyclase n=1 Tax=Litoribrevibacter albus TaxID=1473156 RepID=A0AA37SD74_9GAMM|nr:sensor domain-containing diguanylate cyclase [Litoribrevibacter albus]GLQ33339.1 hypothetical protein GCM10007876_38190 [Litoribrevibacter albus]
MKLRTQLFIFPMGVVFITVCIFISLMWIWRQSDSVLEREEYVAEIHSLVGQLESNLLLYEENPTRAYIYRWEERHKQLTMVLHHSPTLPSDQQTLLNSIKGLNRGLNVLFERLQYLSRNSTPETDALRRHFKDKLVTQLETIVEDSKQLVVMARQSLRDSQLNQIIMIGSILLIGALLLSLLAMSLSVRIRNYLDLLKGGIKALEAGNFSNKLTSAGEDEFCEFINEFNQMQKTLEETTISRDALQKEIDQRTYALKHIASTDPLTQVSNRRKLMEQAELEMARASRHKSPLSLLLIDADHFKKINDSYGHAVGDQVLIHLCRLSEAVMRENDLIARYGGEEFVILLPHTDLSGAGELAGRIQQRLKDQPFKHEGQVIPITISVGVASYTYDQSFADLIAQADRALYQAKQSGRNCIRLSEPKVVLPASDQSLH